MASTSSVPRHYMYIDSIMMFSFLLALSLVVSSSCSTHGASVQAPTDSRVSGHADDIVHTQMNQLMEANKALMTRVEELEEHNKALETRVTETEKQMTKVHGHPSQYDRNVTIGFSASATTNTVYGAYATIKFPLIHMNTGNNYNEATSIFTCSLEGIYYFSVHLSISTSSSAGYGPRAEIARDDNTVVGMYARAVDANDNYMMSTSVLMPCSPFQQVNVKAIDTNVYVLVAYNSSTFNGFYLGV